MSNNGDVEYDGGSCLFSYDTTRKDADVERDSRVSLAFTEPLSLVGKPGIFISIEGEASLVRDKSEFECHWLKDLDRWFPDEIDTQGLIRVKLNADRVHYWDGAGDGTITV